jgi:enamine deaminase RidA (YjgF/YER057c/UK114 family)
LKVTRFSTDNPWERRLGYARAVRAGDFVAVSATAAAGPDGEPLATDARGQATAIFRLLGEALQDAGTDLRHLLRLRVYYVDPSVGEGFAAALGEAFPTGAPALSSVRVVALSDPRFLLEIEADAVAGEGRVRPEQVAEWDEPVD